MVGAKRLVIPNDLFWVVRGRGGAHGIVVLLLEVGDRGEPVSGEGASIGMGQKGREDIFDLCHGSLSRDHMLKGNGYRQVQGGERSRCNR